MRIHIKIIKINERWFIFGITFIERITDCISKVSHVKTIQFSLFRFKIINFYSPPLRIFRGGGNRARFTLAKTFYLEFSAPPG